MVGMGREGVLVLETRKEGVLEAERSFGSAQPAEVEHSHHAVGNSLSIQSKSIESMPAASQACQQLVKRVSRYILRHAAQLVKHMSATSKAYAMR